MARMQFRMLQVTVLILISFIAACKQDGGIRPSSDLNNGDGSTLSGDSGNEVGEGGESGNRGDGGGSGGSDGGTIGGLVVDSFLQDQFTERYDFLWVVDNSGSMSNIRAQMSQILTDFSTVLESRRSLDWQMAVTITDHHAFGGNLIASSTGVRVVKRDTVNASLEWASVIQRIVNTGFSGWEQGLESAHASIANYANEFSRINTPLVVVYLSDEQDFSCQENCNNFSGLPENQTGWTAFPTSRYVDQFAQHKMQNNGNVIVYPIVHLLPLGGANPCDDNYGTQGGRYMAVQEGVATGQSLSLCSPELAASFNTVAQLTANLGICFTLTRTLLSQMGMEVRVDGALVPNSSQQGYVYESALNHVCFNGSYVPDNGSTVSVKYQAQ